MIDDIKANYQKIKDLMDVVEATDGAGKPVDFESSVERAIQMIQSCNHTGGKLMFVGNGGSAAIASHMATDFWKNGGIKAMAFNDSVLLTCLSNDEGYARVFEKPVEKFADKGDLLVAISSSGQSENILRAVQAAEKKGVAVITFSGFKPGNALRRLGAINFYVPDAHYGHVECLHHMICHSFVDVILEQESKIKNQTQGNRERAVVHE